MINPPSKYISSLSYPVFITIALVQAASVSYLNSPSALLTFVPASLLAALSLGHSPRSERGDFLKGNRSFCSFAQNPSVISFCTYDKIQNHFFGLQSLVHADPGHICQLCSSPALFPVSQAPIPTLYLANSIHSLHFSLQCHFPRRCLLSLPLQMCFSFPAWSRKASLCR